MTIQKKSLFVLVAVALPSLALATDYPVQLSVELVKPSGRDYLNLESCQDPASEEIELNWRLESTPVWIGTQDADVFLAADDTCSSAQVEIGKTKDEGADILVSDGQTSGQFPEQGDTLTLADITGLDCTSSSERDYYLCIRWEYEEQVGIYTNKYIYRGGTPLRFDVKRPDPPVLDSVNPGEDNLRVEWTSPADDDIEEFVIHYRQEGSEQEEQVVVGDEKLTSYQVTGLTNGVAYEVWMTAVDKARNESGASNVLVGTPEPVLDFWESYKNSGGSEDGGFCFVATAAWGSYSSASVLKLRQFRDHWLATNAAGRSLIAAYYTYGPRWARAIRHSEPHRAIARWLLAPVVALSALVEAPFAAALLASLGIFSLLVFVLRRKKMVSGGKLGVLVLASAVVLSPQSARASAEALEPGSLSSAGEGTEPVADFQVEFRFGFYKPDIDSEAGLSGTPFKDIFGGDRKFLFELGLDYEFWHGFGTAYVGASAGFVQYLGKAVTASGGSSPDTTVLNLLPLRLGVGWAFDGLWNWVGVPLMPYVEGGFDYYFWWVLDGVGDIAVYSAEDGSESKARGGIFGAHVAVGMKILLDALDREAAGNLFEQVGVINSYLFAEYCWSFIDQFGSGNHFDLSDDTVMFGLAMEF